MTAALNEILSRITEIVTILHAPLSTTAIYADAVGAEEHQIMERIWGTG